MSKLVYIKIPEGVEVPKFLEGLELRRRSGDQLCYKFDKDEEADNLRDLARQEGFESEAHELLTLDYGPSYPEGYTGTRYY